MTQKDYIISTEEQEKLLKKLEGKLDPTSLRIKKYLSMPDLSRTKGSPLSEIVERVRNLEIFKNFDNITIPEVVPTDISFDLFNFPKDHPARSTSDTYYIDEKNILRTHTTLSWYYYLTSDFGKEKIKKNEIVGVLSYGKVYRKDEIDRRHMNIFHQIDGWFITPREKGVIDIEDLKNVLVEIIQSVFGKQIQYRFNPDSFPYTDPSLEMEIQINSQWVEVLGCGVVQGNVLEKLGADSKNYTGWAFGFGLERLAIISMELPDIRLLWSQDPRVKRQLKMGQKFVEVSKYPPVVRDISFVVPNNFIPNDYFDTVRDIAPGLVEQVELIDKYENEAKFGKDKVSYAYRITYRSLDKTLTNEEVDKLHKKLEEETAKTYEATVR